jgi:hypothetical protein
MWHRWFDGAGWQGFEASALALDPSAVSGSSDRIDVFVRHNRQLNAAWG